MENEVWIVSAKRTPIGSFQGQLKSYSAPDLGAVAIRAAMDTCGIEQVDEVYMGCVLPAGCGQAPARQAALGAKLTENTGCTTVNKVCGSGMKSVMLAHDLIKAGTLHCAVAGGMESMTNAPYLLKEARNGMRLGNQTTYDHMFLDGLQDAYEGHLMGVYAQRVADSEAFSRQEMDEWAILSATRAREAQIQGAFEEEIAPIEIKTRQDSSLMEHDEHPNNIKLDKIPQLKPAFDKNGSVTAANSSAISDGAAALVVMDAASARKKGLTPLAVIKAHTTHARMPAEFTIAPVFAIKDLLSTLDWSIDSVDLWEINEAFAVVTQMAVRELGLDPNKVNVKGGACALGHPIGASGARILVTLIHSLRQQQRIQKQNGSNQPKALRGVASLCIGGGEATALAIEIPA
ncbi:thiolase family protein [Vibrio sagamiensis]|uniref:Acetyl-CoA acetyltransferase n=1 Tax=Vibrio sagamiensis NBRC 104589 TaxID=1219064 RepID=A0A511QCS4_9VIBR|nr:thiolase family protein [Vibrio sagamiensis]PNQ61544.1 acetyl-CoA C-acyltransferase [Vibrio agarivorans]GEM75099.1 acetyl-CoA acetyltransferase [Vibrio sagamiensis NBRC 104589]